MKIRNITYLLMILLGCTTPNNQKASVSERMELIPEPDKDLREAYEKAETLNLVKHATTDDLSNEIKKYIPNTCDVLYLATGDVDDDGISDRILVLKNKNEQTSSNYAQDKPSKRQLLLLLGSTDSSFYLAAKNDNIVYCVDCGGIDGDPFAGITIKKGYFSIEHAIAGTGHWEQVTTFKYNKQKHQWALYKDHYISYKHNESNDPNAEALVVDSDELRTAKEFGEIPFEKFNIYQ